MDEYKQKMISLANEAVEDGVFTAEEFELFKAHYGRDDITVIATPRKKSPEAEMAWGISNPLYQTNYSSG